MYMQLEIVETGAECTVCTDNISLEDLIKTWLSQFDKTNYYTSGAIIASEMGVRVSIGSRKCTFQNDPISQDSTVSKHPCVT